MQDIAPEILKRIQSDFKEKCRNDKELGKLIDKIDSGKGDFRDAQGFAEHIGDRLGEAYVENLTEETLPNGRLYRNIAEKVITPTLEYNHELVCDASGKVEQALNEEAGIGLKVQVPELDQDRLNGLINHVSDHEDPFTAEKAQELADLTENFTHHVVDAFIEKNADAHYAAGLSPKIERDAMAECCSWCLDLAGTYEYPLKDRSIYQRHKDCRCVVDYHPGNGRVQNVHTKEWHDETDSDILEARKTIGLEPLVDPVKVEQRKQAENEKIDSLKNIFKENIDNPDSNNLIEGIIENHRLLGGFTPESMKDMLESMGYDVLPLSKGHLKKREFEDGGGYKINFGSDGIFQYHPKEGSHHNGAYWKVKNSFLEKRYDMEGNEK